jgi:hypothetical protein
LCDRRPHPAKTARSEIEKRRPQFTVAFADRTCWLRLSTNGNRREALADGPLTVEVNSAEGTVLASSCFPQ